MGIQKLRWEGKVVKLGNSSYVLIPAILKTKLGIMYKFEVEMDVLETTKRHDKAKEAA